MNWRVSNYVSRQGKGIKRRNESTIIIRKIVAFGTTFNSENINCLFSLKVFPHNEKRYSPLL